MTASQRAAASYRLGVPNMILVLFGSEDFNDFSRRMGLTSRVGDWETGLMTELEIANNRSQEKEEQLRKERDRAKALSSSIAKKRSALQQRVNQHEALMARVANEERARAAAAARSRNTRPLTPLLRMDSTVAAPPLPGSGNARASLAPATPRWARRTPGAQAVPELSTAPASPATRGGPPA